ncbi:mis18-binding protein 1 isoform 1-T1 [Synchiropus picturatus]
MSSFIGVLRESNGRAESPAKLFARMKSRVQKEALARGHGGNFSDEPRVNVLSSTLVAEAITLSPISSPTRPSVDPDLTGFDVPAFVSGLCSPRNRKTRETGQSRADVFSPKSTRKRKLAASTEHASNDAASPPKERRTQPRCEAIQELQHQTTHGLRQSAADHQTLMSPVKALAYLQQKDSRIRQELLKRSDGKALRPVDKGLLPPARGLTPSKVDPSSSDGELTQTISPSLPESPEESPQEVLVFEDPLLVNSPKLEIPKKNKPLIWKDKALCTTFPGQKSEIHLTKWFPRRKHQGLFVDGLRREDNSPWNSNIIVERFSNSVVKTVSGTVYILCGKMVTNRKSDFPRWFLKNFSAGFPPHWKELLDKLLAEGDRTDGKSQTSKPSKAVVKKKPVKSSRSKPLLSPADSDTPSSASSRVSRSGRVLKAPLEYWKGGRVTVDAQMNVTIYECYDTSVVNMNTSPETAHQSKTFLPSDKGKGSSGSGSDHGASVQCRAAPARRRRKAVSDTLDKQSSSEEGPRRLRGRQRSRDAQPQGEPEGQGSKRPTRGGRKAQTTLRQRTQITSSTEDEATDESFKQSFVDRKKMPVKGATRRPASRRDTNAKGGTDKPQTKTTHTNKKPQVNKSTPPPEDVEAWTEAEMQRLQQAVSSLPKHVPGYWQKVATMVDSRTAEECHHKCTAFSKAPSSVARPKRSAKKKVEPAKENGQVLITARAGTLRRKQQVRQFLENMQTENTDDVFSSDFMQKKKFKLPSMSHTSDPDFNLNDLEPMTPKANDYREAKTPQCQHLTPGMFGSPGRNLNDQYVFQLQKRMKKNQFDVRKPSAKSFTPMPDKQMRRCGNTENDTFVVWEMFPEKDCPQADSSSQEDFYFDSD